MPAATTEVDPFPAMPHDHRHCVDTALGTADEVCAVRGARLTELRRRVLELIWRSHAPIGAYRLMELLGQERGRVAPPTVYRALEFLTENGLVHRIESLNAFVGCPAPATAHRAYFLICRGCSQVAEFDDRELAATLDRRVAHAGFKPETERVEIVGTCAQCRMVAA
jgi:Fur family zinc uptake transcriptional regulator